MRHVNCMSDNYWTSRMGILRNSSQAFPSDKSSGYPAYRTYYIGYDNNAAPYMFRNLSHIPDKSDRVAYIDIDMDTGSNCRNVGHSADSSRIKPEEVQVRNTPLSS